MPAADYTVEIVDSAGQADMSVAVVGDQVVDLSSATAGEVLVVQPDGTVAPANPSQTDPYGDGVIRSFPDPATPNSVFPFAANRGHFARLIGAGTITKLRIRVAVQSGNIALALYANVGAGPLGRPGARLGGTGSVACPAAGVADVALTGAVDVPVGAWVGYSANNGTAAILAAIGASDASEFWAGMTGYAEAAFPLAANPAPAVTGYQVRPAVIGIP